MTIDEKILRNLEHCRPWELYNYYFRCKRNFCREDISPEDKEEIRKQLNCTAVKILRPGWYNSLVDGEDYSLDAVLEIAGNGHISKEIREQAKKETINALRAVIPHLGSGWSPTVDYHSTLYLITVSVNDSCSEEAKEIAKEEAVKRAHEYINQKIGFSDGLREWWPDAPIKRYTCLGPRYLEGLKAIAENNHLPKEVKRDAQKMLEQRTKEYSNLPTHDPATGLRIVYIS